jgi:hypothetical protein
MGKIRIENFFDSPFRLKANFLCPPPHKSRNVSAPPPKWIEKLTAMKQVCVSGKVRYFNHM